MDEDQSFPTGIDAVSELNRLHLLLVSTGAPSWEELINRLKAAQRTEEEIRFALAHARELVRSDAVLFQAQIVDLTAQLKAEKTQTNEKTEELENLRKYTQSVEYELAETAEKSRSEVPQKDPPMSENRALNEALGSIDHIVQFAYETGFHELGYNPVQLVQDQIVNLIGKLKKQDAMLDCLSEQLIASQRDNEAAEHDILQAEAKTASLQESLEGQNFLLMAQLEQAKERIKDLESPYITTIDQMAREVATEVMKDQLSAVSPEERERLKAQFKEQLLERLAQAKKDPAMSDSQCPAGKTTSKDCGRLNSASQCRMMPPNRCVFIACEKTKPEAPHARCGCGGKAVLHEYSNGFDVACSICEITTQGNRSSEREWQRWDKAMCQGEVTRLTDELFIRDRTLECNEIREQQCLDGTNAALDQARDKIKELESLIDKTWAASEATAVRGMTTLDDVVGNQRKDLLKLRASIEELKEERDFAIEALRGALIKLGLGKDVV